MKRLFWIFACLFFFSTSLSAQVFEQGRVYFSGGYGFPNFTKVFTSLVLQGGAGGPEMQNVKLSGIGPLHAKVEYALTDRWGLGLSTNIIHFGSTWQTMVQTFDPVTGAATSQAFDYKERLWRYAINLRANYHFRLGGRFDPYIGMGLGYGNKNHTLSTNDPNPNPIFTEAVNTSVLLPIGLESSLGFRYFFTEHIALYFEAGLAKSLLQGGLTYKL